jgi:hypothetical protein
MKPGPYLAGVARGRAVFKLIYAEAISLLPPPVVSEGVLRLESVRSLQSLATELNVAPSTVRGDLILLTNYGWLRESEGRRFLGHRQGGTVFLLADDRAENVTSEKMLVSRLVLQAAPPPVAPDDSKAAVRGPGRKYQAPGAEPFPLPPLG